MTTLRPPQLHQQPLRFHIFCDSADPNIYEEEVEAQTEVLEELDGELPHHSISVTDSEEPADIYRQQYDALIIAPGDPEFGLTSLYSLAAAIVETATANPELHFIILSPPVQRAVDGVLDDDPDGLDNLHEDFYDFAARVPKLFPNEEVN